MMEQLIQADEILAMAKAMPDPVKEPEVVVEPEVEDNTVSFKRGDFFRDADSTRLYHLCLVDNDPAITNSCKMVLIDLYSGNRYTNPKVVKDIKNLTKQEFKAVCAGDTFIKISRLEATRIISNDNYLI